jgi:UMF1 family MFS transporter
VTVPQKSPTSPDGPRAPVRALVAWAFFDWANSAHPTLVTTFIFAAYFTKAVAPDPVTGTSLWGYAVSLSALAVAVLSPLLGAIADNSGRRKPWLFVLTALTVGVTALLWFVKPNPTYIVLALVLAGIGNFAFELGMVFYNAMLPTLVPRSMIGRLSGWAWGLGYLGGLACLAVALLGFLQPERPWFGVGKDEAANVRATMLLVAVWFAVFAVPLFVFTPDQPAARLKPLEAVRAGAAALVATVRELRAYKTIIMFLVAMMFCLNALTTLFAFGGIYAASLFGMDFDELLIFGIAMNVTAGVGAALFGWVDDWIGPKRTILIAVGCLTALAAGILTVESKTLFWALALPLGLFVGPAQAAGRSFMARLAPATMRAEMFGLYALSGKATAFLGPAVLAWVTDAFQSQRVGMAVILAFFVIGALLLLPVPDAGGAPREAAS